MADLPISGLTPGTPLSGDEFAINQGLASRKVNYMQLVASPNFDVSMSGTPFSSGTVGRHLNAIAVVTMTTFDSVESNQTVLSPGTMWPIEAELGIVTVAPGAGVTLEYFDGASIQSGGTVDLAVGSGAVLRKVSDSVYRITGNGITYVPAPPAYTLSVTDVTIQEFSTAPAAFQSKSAGYELQGDGNTYALTQADDSGGPPNFNIVNILTDWLDNKAEAAGATVHVRMTQTGGTGVLGGGSGALNVWLEVGVDATIWVVVTESGNGFQNFIGTIEISDDGGSTTADSATVTLETDEI